MSVIGDGLLGTFKFPSSSSVYRTQTQKSAERISVKDFGAVGDGVADDTAAFLSAISGGAGRIILVPVGTYKITSQIAIPDGSFITLAGEGAGSILLKSFNGDLISLGSQCRIIDIAISGQGSAFTGGGIVISTGSVNDSSWRHITDVNVSETQDSCIKFTAPVAGFGSSVSRTILSVYNDVTYVISLDPSDESQGMRSFIDVSAFRGGLIDLGGSENTLILGCKSGSNTINDAIKFRADTVKARVVGNRFANQQRITVVGTNNVVVGNMSATGYTIGSGAFSCVVEGNGGINDIIDSSGNQTNQWSDIGFTVFTPTWGASVSAPSIGNGFLAANYSRIGRTVVYAIEFIAGSTTTFGSGAWTFSLPFIAGARKFIGNISMTDVGGGEYIGFCQIDQSASVLQARFQDIGGPGVVTSVAPFTWVDGDRMSINITYQLG